MRFTAPTTGVVAGLALVSAPALVAAQQCNADNCYNQIQRFSASSFCSAFTTAVVTAVTAFPTFVSTSCGAARVSSACSCLYPPPACATTTKTVTVALATTTVIRTVTVATATTTTANPVATLVDQGVVRNGLFGLDAWYNGDIIASSSYGYNEPKLVQPGQASSWAVLFTFPFDGIYEYDTNVVYTPNTRYTLSFWAKGGGQIMASLTYGLNNGYFSQKAFSLGADWTQYSLQGLVDGTHTSGAISLVAQAFSGENNAIYLDNVVLAKTP